MEDDDTPPSFVEDAPFNAAERSLADAFDRQTAYRGWSPLTLNVENRHFPAFHIPADSPKGVVAFVTGCASSPLLFPHQISTFRKNGLSVVALPLVHREHDADYVETNQRLVEWFLLNENSPVHALYDSDTARYLLDHSAGSLHTTRALTPVNNAKKAAQAFSHIFRTAPFYDTVDCSIAHPFERASAAEKMTRYVLSNIYSVFAHRHKDTPVGETWADSLYLRLKGHDERAVTDSALISSKTTHGNAVELRAHGRNTTRMFTAIRQNYNGTHPIETIPHTYYISPDETASCPRVGERFARFIGAEIVTCGPNTKHNPLVEDQTILPHILSTIEAQQTGNLTAKATADTTPLAPRPEAPRMPSESDDMPLQALA